MKDHLAELEKTAREVGEAVKDAVAVGADVMQSRETDAERPDDGSGNGGDDGPGDDGNPFSKLNI